MNKKFLIFIMVVLSVISMAFLLTACGNGDDNNYYFTIETPEHSKFEVFSLGSNAEGKTFVNKGNIFEGNLLIDPGYEVKGDIIIKVNGEEVDWTNKDTSSNTYYFSFEPTSDFTISIECRIVESTYKVEFVKEEYTVIENLKEIYIRFANEKEQTLLDFLSSSDSIKYMKYDENIEFWLYTKGFVGEPSINASLSSEFYSNEENNEYGYHYYTAVQNDNRIEFCGIIPINIYMITDVDEVNGISGSDIVDTEKLKMTVNDDCTALTITIDESIPQDILSQLVLIINGESQTVSLTTGVNNITLKKAYEYTSADGLEYSMFHYNINLNFYKFSVFKSSNSAM